MSGTIGTVLFLDDEPELRRANAQTLELAGFSVLGFEAALPALDRIATGFEGVVVSDVKLPDLDGQEFLRRVRARDPDLPVILITGHGDVPMAVASMRAGAYDFIEKPYPAERLLDSVRRAAEKRRLVVENRGLRQAIQGRGVEGRLLGTTRAMDDLRRSIRELAPTSASVIVHGETGSGKEVVARSLHEFGDRAGRPFVALNCAAIPEQMFESELFGHEAGAFTGAGQRRIGRLEYADGGTVFLDEIESMPLSAQAKILRVLQERSLERLGSNRTIPVDIRLVAATKVDLLEASAAGRFRADLYYRLAVTELEIPPLRARREDIPLLFEFFAGEAARLHRREAPPLDPEGLVALDAHGWPGNVRELKNIAERFVLRGGRGGVAGLMGRGRNSEPAPERGGAGLAQQVEAFERRLICQALERCNGDMARTTELLGLPRRTLNEKVARHGIDRRRFVTP